MNTFPTIRAIRQQMAIKEAQFDKDMQYYENAIKALEDINTACPCCEGTGYRTKTSMSDLGVVYCKVCPTCKGSGLAEGINTKVSIDE